MMRLDKFISEAGFVDSRSKAEETIKNGEVTVNGKVINKPSYIVSGAETISVNSTLKYVSRAALKLKSVAERLEINFKDKTVLDVGSSTGGFTEFALEQGAKKVIAVDVGTDQMHKKLLADPRIELHEKTDIRNFTTKQRIDLVVADVSFISLTMILPSVKLLVRRDAEFVVMCKPQFEAGAEHVNKGVIKNSKIRRQVLKDFESWLTANGFFILDKADSSLAGSKGNVERFYKLQVSS